MAIVTEPSGTFNSTEDFNKAIIQTVASNQHKFLFKLWDNVIKETPKYSGTLRAGWRMQVNSPSKFMPKLTKEPDYYDYPGQPDLLKYKRIHKRVYLTNNVPYIGFVNDGISGNEANFGFIDRAIQNSIDEWLGS